MLGAYHNTRGVRATFSRLLGAPFLVPLPAGKPSQACGSPLANVVAATVCRLEAGAPSRYDACLVDQCEKQASTRHATARHATAR